MNIDMIWKWKIVTSLDNDILLSNGKEYIDEYNKRVKKSRLADFQLIVERGVEHFLLQGIIHIKEQV